MKLKYQVENNIDKVIKTEVETKEKYKGNKSWLKKRKRNKDRENKSKRTHTGKEKNNNDNRAIKKVI